MKEDVPLLILDRNMMLLKLDRAFEGLCQARELIEELQAELHELTTTLRASPGATVQAIGEALVEETSRLLSDSLEKSAAEMRKKGIQ